MGAKKTLRNIILGSVLAFNANCGDSLPPSIPESTPYTIENTEKNCTDGTSWEVHCGYNNSGVKEVVCWSGALKEGACIGEYFPPTKEIISPPYEFPSPSECPVVECPNASPAECPTVECPVMPATECPDTPTAECPSVECPEIPECPPSPECTLGSIQTEYRVLDCGINERGKRIEERNRECQTGSWNGWSGWRETYYCLDSDTCTDDFVRSEDCGFNGTQQITCIEGREVYGDCLEILPACLEDAVEREMRKDACGLNGRGVQYFQRERRCEAGDWSAWDGWTALDVCGDPDDCMDNHAKTEPCGINQTGQQRFLCTEGTYLPDGFCEDNDLCSNEAEYADITCGYAESGSRSISCAEGSLLFGECLGEVLPEPTPPKACLEGFVFTGFAEDSSDERTRYDIYFTDLNGRNLRNLTANAEASIDFAPVPSPDGEKVAFVSLRDYGNHEIYLMNIDGSNQQDLSNNLGEEDHRGVDVDPAFSPDGTRIAFTSGRDTVSPTIEYKLYIMNADGTEVRMVSDLIGDGYTHVAHPSWFPDGETIAFSDSRNTSSGRWREIYSIKTDGSGLTNLSQTPYTSEYSPSVSPDGKKIVYTQIVGYNSSIYILELASGTKTFIASGTSPSWSPEGERIAFSTQSGGSPEEYCNIAVVNADGTGQYSISNEEIGVICGVIDIGWVGRR